MTDKQPEALRLADLLSDRDFGSFTANNLMDKAAAELRRLHQSEKEGWRYAKELDQERNRLEGINAELVEAVKAALSDDQPYIEKCKAAIAKVTGEQHE
jgi:multidrug resistance efflux pump